MDYIPVLLGFLSFYCLELGHYSDAGRDAASVQEMLGVILKDGQYMEASVHQLGLAAVCPAGCCSGTLHLS